MKLILVSHGPLSAALLKSAEMIVGPVSGASSLSLKPGMSPDRLQEEIAAELKKDAKDPDIVLALDLLGGTPANVASKLLAVYPQLHLVTGMNLPLVIEFANQQLLGGTLHFDQLLAMGKQGIVDIKAQLLQADDDDDEL